MESNLQYDEFLVRYLLNEETEEEKVLVENWLNASEENLLYFHQLKKAWELTSINQDLAYLTQASTLEEKWKRLEHAITGEEARVVSINKQHFSVDEDQQENDVARKPKVYRVLVAAAIAASVLLVIGFGWKLFSNNKPETPVAHNTEIKKDSLTFIVRREVNTSRKEKRIALPDGSLIVLAMNSEVTYREPFRNERNIALIGKALFKVAKDKTRPFIVTSGDISTTALGTEFTVTTFEKSNKVIVRLYEGKVVVKALSKANQVMTKDVYLLPGQAFVYARQTTAKVEKFKSNGTSTPRQIIEDELMLDNPSIPESTEAPYFMFNNQPLSEVFDNLAGLYNIEIKYNKIDVQDMYLIGKYNSSDSLETILKRISALNNLTVTKQDNAYIISKQ